VLTRPKAGETGIVLIIDDAQLLTDRALKFLDLVLSTARLARSPLHLLLVGTPLLWERLPAAGNLAAGKVDTCIRLANAAAPAGPIPNRPVPDRPVAEAAVRPPVSEAGLLGAPGFGAPGLGATGFTDETGHRARAAGDRRGPRLGGARRGRLRRQRLSRQPAIRSAVRSVRPDEHRRRAASGGTTLDRRPGAIGRTDRGSGARPAPGADGGDTGCRAFTG
jgi:hypothetical protein